MRYLQAGNILFVDLTTGHVTKKRTAEYDDFFGMRGINAKLVYDLTGPDTDPLGPDNALAFGSGPLSGTFAPGSSRCGVRAKSPATKTLGESNMGGYWGAELKYAGYDHLVVTGRADHPVYLAIKDDQVEIRDASHLWGKDTYDIPPIVKKETGEPEAQVITIGKAGENLVRYASILTKVGDAAGKTGMGTVMGSKNLKAVVVRGTKSLRVANADRYFQECTRAHEDLKNAKWLVKDGNATDMDSYGHVGVNIMGNFTSSEWEHRDDALADDFRKKNLLKRAGCFSCPVRCMDQYNIPGVGAAVTSCTFYTELTWKTQNYDMDKWWRHAVMCQRYGLDPITVGSMIAWAMDLYERGIIDRKDTDGVDLRFGNADAITEMIEKIANREGFGDVLADDVFSAVERVGRGSGDHMYHVKGNTMYAINQMNYRGKALGAAVGTRGDFMKNSTLIETQANMARVFSSTAEEAKAKIDAWREMARKISGNPDAIEATEYDGKPALVVYYENLIAVPDLAGTCKWHSPYYDMPITPEHIYRIYSAGIGQDWGEDQMMEVVRRVRALERAYDAREGMTKADDKLPKRFFETPLPGKYPDDVLDKAKFEKMKDEYYALRGWDVKTGNPGRAHLEAVGLKSVADDLEKLGRLPVEVPEEVMVEA